jgi:HAD superfamily hydrolase (TIGR01509 family)
MGYKAILFDMDGVIVDSEPLHVAAFQATLQQYGRALSEDQYLQHFAGRTDEAGFQRYFDFIGETVELPVIMDQKAKAYLALAADQLMPYPGVIEVIRKLAEQQTPLALVTGSLRTEAEVTLKTFEITDYFSTIVAAEDTRHGKPNPEGYLKAAETLGIDPVECIVVEDSPSGVAAAKAAGMKCLAITNTHTAEALQEATSIVAQLRSNDLESL